MRTLLSLRLLTIATVCATALTSAAAANPRINTELFKPSSHRGDLFGVQSSDTMGHLLWKAAIWGGFSTRQLVYQDPTNSAPDYAVIDQRVSAEIQGSLRLWDRLSVGLALPLALSTSGDDSGFINHTKPPSFALGDLRLDLKAGLLVRDHQADGLGLAIGFGFGLPTGDDSAFFSDGFTFVPRAIVDGRIGPILLSANLGYQFRSEQALPFETTASGEFVWGAGISVDAVPQTLTLIGEIEGGSADYSSANANHIEGRLGATWNIAQSGFGLTVGGGSALTKGWGSVKYRIFGALSYAAVVTEDPDGDGIMGDADRCPLDAEDLDKFQDEDGCPDLDNDTDLVPDTVDQCPLIAEDRDGYEDADGCPELDNDKDGVADTSDKCNLVPEDRDGFEDEDGCPEDDNDKDGIKDGDDKCPNDPEDFDGFEDSDGCPDDDNDQDGIKDGDDDCPNDPENKCNITVNPCEIVIGEKIFFAYKADTVDPKSYALLDALVSVFRTRDWIKKVEIQGHTDDKGKARHNQQLSQRRAEAVRAYLTGKGLSTQRLTAVGHGEAKPIASNRNGSGRAKNRRVQFIIVEPSQGDCAKGTDK